MMASTNSISSSNSTRRSSSSSSRQHRQQLSSRVVRLSSPAPRQQVVPQAQQPHDQQQQQRPVPEAQPSRRQLLLASALAWQLSRGATPAAQAAAAAAAPPAAACQLQEAPSGLRWCDLVVGEGQLAIKGAFTKLNYTAKLASTGAVFDSTYQRKQPLIFKVGDHEMIEAFDVAVLGAEGLPPMREGGRRRLVVPPGPLQRQGVKSLTWVTGLLDALEEAGESISPDGSFNSVLEFDVELVPKRQRG